MSRSCRWLAVAALFCSAEAVRGSNAFPHLSLDDLVAQSEIIVSGKVVRSWSGWDSEHRFIWTHHEIRISETWKGKAGGTVVVSEPGGDFEGRSMRVPGSTAYTVGEEVNVFAYRTPIGFLRTTNYGQGKVAAGVNREQLRTQVRQALEKQKGAAAR